MELFPATSVYASVLGGKVSSLEDVDSSVSVLGSATPCHVASLPQEETALSLEARWYDARSSGPLDWHCSFFLGTAFQVLCSVGIKKKCSIVCGRCGTFSLCIRRFVVALKMKRCSFKLVRMCDRALVSRWQPRAEVSGIGAEDGQPPATSWVRGGVPLRALACHVPS